MFFLKCFRKKLGDLTIEKINLFFSLLHCQTCIHCIFWCIPVLYICTIYFRPLSAPLFPCCGCERASSAVPVWELGGRLCACGRSSFLLLLLFASFALRRGRRGRGGRGKTEEAAETEGRRRREEEKEEEEQEEKRKEARKTAKGLHDHQNRARSRTLTSKRGPRPGDLSAARDACRASERQ